jgi:hypothetical protein
LPLEVVAPPDDGVWRVGRAPDPLAPPDRLPQSALDQPTTGNRFDSPTGAYRVLYFATTLEGCFGEALARFRRDPSMLALVQDEWSQRGFMRVGDVPSDWRQRRIAVHVRFPQSGPSAVVCGSWTSSPLRHERCCEPSWHRCWRSTSSPIWTLQPFVGATNASRGGSVNGRTTRATTTAVRASDAFGTSPG